MPTLNATSAFIARYEKNYATFPVATDGVTLFAATNAAYAAAAPGFPNISDTIGTEVI